MFKVNLTLRIKSEKMSSITRYYEEEKISHGKIAKSLRFSKSSLRQSGKKHFEQSTFPGLKPKSCDDIKKLTPDAVSGVFTIWIGGSATEVYCEVDANGTMWTVSRLASAHTCV